MQSPLTCVRIAGLFLLALGISGAQTPPSRPAKKAIVIGINCYDITYGKCPAVKAEPPTSRIKRVATASGDWSYWSYRNLEGAKNDAGMMRSVLNDHGFTIPDDAYLIDEKATADNILAALHKYLIEDPDIQEGDLRVVYYSGHGNYVRNLAAAVKSEFDETIVPSDHWRGTPDIRDKELSRIFAEAGKKVKVVFIADSCHSGSLSRGPAGRVKTAEAGSADDPKAPKVNDKPSAADPVKAKYGLVLVSAARRDQPALETDGRSDDPNNPFTGPHGAFTWSLKQALDANQYAPIDEVFQKAASFLALDKPAQVANIEGLNRDGINLFGEKANGAAVQRLVTQDVSDDNQEVRVRGGAAIGVYKNTELKRIPESAGVIRIRVTDEEGLSFSTAGVIQRSPGAAPIKPGDLFEVDKWVAPASAMLKVYVPPAAPAAVISAALVEAAKLKGALGGNWVEDETLAEPTHTLSWNGKAWQISSYLQDERGTELGAALISGDVLKRLPAGAKLLAVLPPSPELSAALPFSAAASRIQLMKTPADANYRLRGRAAENAAYAWIRTSLNVPALKGREATLAMPPATDWIAVPELASPKAAAGALADNANLLGRLREWQTIGPVGRSPTVFPYTLAVAEVGTGKYRAEGEVTGGLKYKLYLRADPKALKSLGKPVTPRYVYIFSLDQHGCGTALWPRVGQGNQDNVFPVPAAEGEPKTASPGTIAVSGDEEYDLKVRAPYGLDTYIMLSSVQRVDNPDMFNSKCVIAASSAARGGSSGNPLSDLLSEVGSLTRAANPPIPADWSIERVYLSSVPPK